MVNPRRDVTFQLPGEIPTDTMCLQITIPKGAYYARQFYAAIEQMSFWFAYDGDAAHTGAKVANLWKAALRTIAACPNQTNIYPCGCGGDDCMCNQLRFHNCVLQQFDCLTQMWIDVPSDDNCVPNTAPGGGTTPPGGGVCQDYQMQFTGNAWTILPFVVNSGDTLQINALKGAGTDGGPNWYCPDGEYFLLGGCDGGAHGVSTDPLPTSPHMCVILRIGSNYYPFFMGTFTVPSGIVNQSIYIGVNNSSLANNAGTYAIDFNYCNHSAPPVTNWCHNSNFLVTPDGWTAPGYPGGGGFCETGTLASGLWSTSGWRGQLYHQGDCTDLSVLTYIALDLGAPTPLTNIQFDFDLETVAHPFDSWEIFGSTTLDNSGDVGLASASNPGTGPKSAAWMGTATYRYVKISLIKLQNAGSSPTATITSAEIKGTGASPLGPSNC